MTKPILGDLYPLLVLQGSFGEPAAWQPYPRCEERERWRSLPAGLSAALLRQGEKARQTPWPELSATIFLHFHRSGDSAEYDELRTRRRRILRDMVLAECIEDRGRYVDAIANAIWSTCEETFWGSPAHLYLQHRGSGLPDVDDRVVELFTGETANVLTLSGYLLRRKLDKVSPLIFLRITEEVNLRFLEPAFVRDDFWWMGNDPKRTPNNWNPWINSNLLIACLLTERDSARRAAIIAKILKNLDHYLESYSADGGCEEGPLYWGRAGASYFECLSILNHASAGRIDVFGYPFLRAMAQYVGDTHIGDGYFTNFGDGPPRPVQPGEVVYRFARATGNDALASFGAWLSQRGGVLSALPAISDEHGGLNRALAAIFCAAEMTEHGAKQMLTGASWYEDLALMTVRSRPQSTQGFFLGVQAAKTIRSHGHLDSGSFIVFHNARPVFIDVGVGSYTARTFSTERYQIWTMQTQFHNLPTVGADGETDEPGFKAAVVAHRIDDSGASVTLQLAPAYPQNAHLEGWLRRLTLNRRKEEFTIADEVSLGQPATVGLHFMTTRLPALETAGVVRLTEAHGVVEGSAPIALHFDATLLKAAAERVKVDDSHIRATWGGDIFRVTLTSLAPVSKAQFAVRCVVA